MNKLSIMTAAAALLMAIAVPAADHDQKIVFVTSAAFDGNLGGLSGADDKCQAEADGPASIVPSGIYWAWLSDGFDSPVTGFTRSSHTYMLLDGTKIAEDFTDLTDGSILHAINIDSTGKPLGLQLFWTGTNPDGTTVQNFVTCNGWTDPLREIHGVAGSTVQTSTLWSAYSSQMTCGMSLRLACFQQ